MNNNIELKKVQVVKPKKIEKDQIVKVVIQGETYADVLCMDRPAKATIRKLDKNRYCVLKTGEIKEYQKKEEKDKANLRKTFVKLRQLIRTNFESDSSNQLFITLTYAENMTDEKRLMKDFDKFIKRLKYCLKGHNLDYIVVMEPQGRGAWHAHLMLKSDKPVLYIDNKKLEKIWGFGYTDTQRLKSDDVGSYYVAYFTDVLEETKGGKKRVKGGRLGMYPKNFKFYRTSRGIKQPKEIYTEYENLEKAGYKKTYQQAFQLVDETGSVLNTFQKETWKRKRKKKWKGGKKEMTKEQLFEKESFNLRYEENGASQNTQILREKVNDLEYIVLNMVECIKLIDECTSVLEDTLHSVKSQVS